MLSRFLLDLFSKSFYKDQVFLGVFVGAILGAYSVGVGTLLLNTISSGVGFSYLMKFSHRHGFIDRESYVAQYLALAIFITGVVNTVGSDDLLAAFAAGEYLRQIFSSTYL